MYFPSFLLFKRTRPLGRVRFIAPNNALINYGENL
jgi:hypothetical protein